jgi:uncharacterized protein YjiS (DUF1127 family)
MQFRIAAAQHSVFCHAEPKLYRVQRPSYGRKAAERIASVLISRFVRLVRAWWRYNESVRELARLNDRELADIGISRSEITAIAWSSARNG